MGKRPQTVHRALAALAATLFAASPGLPARTHAAALVPITVTLTLARSVPTTDTFSLFVGATQNPPELVLCGRGRVLGLVPPCRAGATLVQRLAVPVGVATPISIVRFSGPFGPAQSSHTILLDDAAFTRAAAIGVVYPAPTIPITFRLRLNGVVPARETFAVNYPHGVPNDVQFCGGATAPGGASTPCVGGGMSYATTIQVPVGQFISFAFYRVRLTPRYLMESSEVFAPGRVRATRATAITASYTFRR